MKNILKIYCDGGARGNPGEAASSFVVEKDGRLIHRGAKYIGKTTNNVAEYNAVILALTWLGKTQKDFSEKSVYFILDSELVAKQLSGVYKIKNENLRSLFWGVKNLEKKISKKIIYTNVSREKNKLADFLVNQTLDQKSSSFTKD